MSVKHRIMFYVSRLFTSAIHNTAPMWASFNPRGTGSGCWETHTLQLCTSCCWAAGFLLEEAAFCAAAMVWVAAAAACLAAFWPTDMTQIYYYKTTYTAAIDIDQLLSTWMTKFWNIKNCLLSSHLNYFKSAIKSDINWPIMMFLTLKLVIGFLFRKQDLFCHIVHCIFLPFIVEQSLYTYTTGRKVGINTTF